MTLLVPTHKTPANALKGADAVAHLGEYMLLTPAAGIHKLIQELSMGKTLWSTNIVNKQKG